ncbi:MAG: S-layer family protein [Rhizonema sp. NSF051]|nr:S-layer family protein [Rhizonema sp. NSF051]
MQDLSNGDIFSNIESGGIGHGGDINIKAGSLALTQGAQLQTSINKADANLPAGRGDAGNVTLDVLGKVTITGAKDGFPSGIFSDVQTGGIGNGGNINIKSGSFELSNRARLSSSTFGQGNAGSISLQASNSVQLSNNARLISSTSGQGNAGSISIQASNSVSFANGDIFSNVESGGIGHGGDINIKAGSLALTQGAQLQTSINKADANLPAGRGDAGNVTLDVLGKVTITGAKDGFPSGIFSDVQTGGIGNGGNINIKSGSFELSNGAQLSSSTFGQGNAGSISIQATNSVSFANSDIFSNVESGGIGHGGNINIKAGSLALTQGAQLQTSINKADANLPAGRGDAGNVTLDVLGKVTITGAKDGFPSGIFSDVQTGGIGNGGNINIKSGSFELSNRARLSSSTFGQGNAGSISIQASNNAISLANGLIFSSVQSEGVGHGGDINIQARSLSLTDDSSLFASTSGQGNAGNISIQATDLVSLASSGILSNVAKGAVGNSGNINIQAGSFSLTDESQVAASNLGGKGSAGNIFINTVNDVSIRNGAFINTGTSGEGNAGKITIRSGGTVSISGRSETTSSGVDSGILSSGMGNGGDIEIQARSFLLSDTAGLRGITLPGSVGHAGNISISTIDDVIFKNASVATLNYSRGNAGNIAIRAGGNVYISQQSLLNSAVGPNAVGSGGNIDIQGRNFSLSDKSQLVTVTLGKGDAGNFKINTTGNITLTSGAQIGTDTYGIGNAGNITVNAGGTLSLDGIGSNGSISEISTQVGSQQGFFGIGKAGDININARNLSITNHALLTSQSLGQGNAGDININTRSVKLDNQGAIAATTNSGDGGNINLTAADYLLLRHNSSISTTAGTAQSSGNGGNITINTPSGFIVAIENENSDITANSFNGFGGKVQINTTGIFGITPLSLQDLKRLRPLDLDSSQLPTNDITAISQQNPSLSGPVSINSVDIDPTHGLVTLPTVTENPPKLVSANCAAFDERSGGSQFTVTGRGGLPSNPDESLTSDVVWTDARLPVTTTLQAQHKTHAAKPKPKPVAIIPATGWVFNDKGEVTLISSVTNATSVSTPTGCPVR